MTNFDKLVAAGPETLAHVLTESKINASVMVVTKLGIEFECPDELRKEIYKEHYDFLTKEI